MNLKKHQQRHAKLFQALDELVADMITQTTMLPSETTVLELMKWAQKQRHDPTETDEEAK